MRKLSLEILPELFAVYRLEPGAVVPDPSLHASFFSVTRTSEELSVVCPEADAPSDIRAERGFRLFRVLGPLDFSLVGVLASLLSPLADAEVSVFAVSTHDTDYILVREEDLETARLALAGAGHAIRSSQSASGRGSG